VTIDFSYSHLSLNDILYNVFKLESKIACCTSDNEIMAEIMICLNHTVYIIKSISTYDNNN